MSTKRKGLKVRVYRRGGEDRDALVETAVRTAAADMLSTRMANTLSIRVELRSSKLAANVGGQCGHADMADRSRKTIKIVLDRDLPTLRLRQLVAHEMKHAEQFLTGRLRWGTLAGARGYFWRPGPGRATFYPWSDDLDTYRSWPWEREARQAEVGVG